MFSSINLTTSLGAGFLTGAGWGTWKHRQSSDSCNLDAIAKIGKVALKGAVHGGFCYFMAPVLAKCFQCWTVEPEHACSSAEVLTLFSNCIFGGLFLAAINYLNDTETPQTPPVPDTPFPEEPSGNDFI